MSGKGKGRVPKKIVDLVVVLLFGGVLFAGVVLWIVAFRGPEKSAPTETSAAVQTASIKLAWDRSPSEYVTGYRILYGTQPKNYTNSVSVGNETTATVGNLKKVTRYYIVAVAVDASGNQSPPSNEITVVTSD